MPWPVYISGSIMDFWQGLRQIRCISAYPSSGHTHRTFSYRNGITYGQTNCCPPTAGQLPVKLYYCSSGPNMVIYLLLATIYSSVPIGFARASASWLVSLSSVPEDSQIAGSLYDGISFFSQYSGNIILNIVKFFSNHPGIFFRENTRFNQVVQG